MSASDSAGFSTAISCLISPTSRNARTSSSGV
jgi:hypothetical protein